MDEGLRRFVRERARSICEYCRRPQSRSDLPFAIDHIIARQHGGPTVAENLAFVCQHCNSHKGPNIAGIDPVLSRMERLFHPRRDRWEDHFEWAAHELVGITAVGRTTIVVLAMNDDFMLRLRATLLLEGEFPPPPAPS
jgi:HNH endonuclease